MSYDIPPPNVELLTPLCNITDPPMSYDIPPYVILHAADQKTCGADAKLHTKSSSSSSSSELRSLNLSSEVCEEKTAGNSHTNLSESKIYTFQKEENELSTEELDIAYGWRRQIVKTFPNSIYDVFTLGSFVRKANKIIQILNPELGDIYIVLGFVASKGNTYLTSMFFQKPPEIFEVDKYGTTPLEEACRKLEDHFKLEKVRKRF